MKLSKLILENKEIKYTPLPFAYNALEPHIDEETMKEHFTKHFKGYVNKLNDALKGKKEVDGDIIKVLGDIKNSSLNLLKSPYFLIISSFNSPTGVLLPSGVIILK